MTSDDSDPTSYDVTAQWTTNPDRNLITLTCKSREPQEAQDFMDTLKPIIDNCLCDDSLIEELEQLADEWDKSAYAADRPERYGVSEISGLRTAKEELREVLARYD
jgi:hypothetical protein